MCPEQDKQRKTSHPKAFRIILGLYACAATLAVVLLVARPGMLESVKFALTNDIRVYAGYTSEMRGHQAQRSRADTLVILGDSIARGLDGREIYDGPSTNFGIGGDTIAGAAMRVTTYDIGRTETLILLVGVNDLARYSDQQIITNYRLLLDYLKAKSVLACAVLPLNETRFRPARITKLNGNKVTNARITQVNQEIEKLCRGYSNVRFCGPASLLVDDAANLRAGFTTDGVHPNQEGNTVLERYLRDELRKLRGEEQDRGR